MVKFNLSDVINIQIEVGIGRLLKGSLLRQNPKYRKLVKIKQTDQN